MLMSEDDERDAEVAGKIRALVQDINGLLDRACDRRMLVELDVHTQAMVNGCPRLAIRASSISKQI